MTPAERMKIRENVAKALREVREKAAAQRNKKEIAAILTGNKNHPKFEDCRDVNPEGPRGRKAK